MIRNACNNKNSNRQDRLKNVKVKNKHNIKKKDRIMQLSDSFIICPYFLYLRSPIYSNNCIPQYDIGLDRITASGKSIFDFMALPQECDCFYLRYSDIEQRLLFIMEQLLYKWWSYLLNSSSATIHTNVSPQDRKNALSAWNRLDASPSSLQWKIEFEQEWDNRMKEFNDLNEEQWYDKLKEKAPSVTIEEMYPSSKYFIPWNLIKPYRRIFIMSNAGELSNSSTPAIRKTQTNDDIANNDTTVLTNNDNRKRKRSISEESCLTNSHNTTLNNHYYDHDRKKLRCTISAISTIKQKKPIIISCMSDFKSRLNNLIHQQQRIDIERKEKLAAKTISLSNNRLIAIRQCDHCAKLFQNPMKKNTHMIHCKKK